MAGKVVPDMINKCPVPTGDLVIKPEVPYCHNLSPGPWLLSQPKSITTPWPVPNYAAW